MNWQENDLTLKGMVRELLRSRLHMDPLDANEAASEIMPTLVSNLNGGADDFELMAVMSRICGAWAEGEYLADLLTDQARALG